MTELDAVTPCVSDFNQVPRSKSSTCTAIVGNYEVYYDAFHVTAAYSTFLEGVLARSLSLTAGK